MKATVIAAGLLLAGFTSRTQMITGTWHGKINRQKVEVKIIQKGDSLTGTSYYYETASRFRRYSIKGYFDPETNSAVWWDDELLDERSGAPGKTPMLSRADFNCPGGAKMMLDGKTALRDDDQNPKGDVHLDKVDGASFGDEWDFVIDNYTAGANDPDIIDSIASISSQRPIETITEEKPRVIERPVVKTETPIERPVVTAVATPQTIEQKFGSREKIFTKEIPVTGDSIELRFYDNAEVDGDSISLFLDGKLLFEHIRLTEKAYKIKLPVSELQSTSELIMVAENLGAIPPNTSFMVAIVGDNRYEAQLASTENSSAMIRLRKN